MKKRRMVMLLNGRMIRLSWYQGKFLFERQGRDDVLILVYAMKSFLTVQVVRR